MIFLDLEETIIDTWQGNAIINVDKIKKFLGNTKEVGIFSFAIWNDVDKEFFEKNWRSAIENTLGIKAVVVPSVSDMMKVDFDLRGIRFDDIFEFIVMNKKEGAFRSWCLTFHIGQHTILVDDAVPNLIIDDEDTRTKIQLVNVNKLGRT